MVHIGKKKIFKKKNKQLPVSLMDLYFTSWKIRSNKMQAYFRHSTWGHLIRKKNNF